VFEGHLRPPEASSSQLEATRYCWGSLNTQLATFPPAAAKFFSKWHNLQETAELFPKTAPPELPATESQCYNKQELSWFNVAPALEGAGAGSWPANGRIVAWFSIWPFFPQLLFFIGLFSPYLA
jgi:hypothetical protein